MKYEMKDAVYEEMMKHMDQKDPSSVEDFVQQAAEDFEMALLLPFYMYYYHPHEWQNYSLFADNPLPKTLNCAAYIALDAPVLNVDPKLKCFFHGTYCITSSPPDDRTMLSLEEWTMHLFRKYWQLYQKTSFFGNHVEVLDNQTFCWIPKTTQR